MPGSEGQRFSVCTLSWILVALTQAQERLSEGTGWGALEPPFCGEVTREAHGRAEPGSWGPTLSRGRAYSMAARAPTLFCSISDIKGELTHMSQWMPKGRCLWDCPHF